MGFSSLLVALTVVVAVSANNDWSKPCFGGVCEYDLPDAAGAASGTLKIWGPTSSISDVTPAAGWEIIGCSPDALQQDIRLVCKDASSADCNHLYDSSGAEGKIIRLPENCGKGPFAVVSKAYTPTDQSIPSSIARRLVRRDGTLPEVKGLSIGVDFSPNGPARKASPINFAIRAANVPGAKGEIDTTQKQRRSMMRVVDRGLFDFVKEAIDAISSLNDFDVDKSTTLPPFDINKSFNLLDKSISCPPVDAHVKVDVNAAAHAVATIGLAVTGTMVPPKIDEFAIISNLNADLIGALHVNAGATGTLDTGKIKLFEVGIPGLDFPGILTLGPSFQINAQAKALLDLNFGLAVGFDYKINKAQLVFPPNSKQAAGGSFNIGDTPLILSASPGVKATGSVEAHFIPSLNLGIDALGGVATAEVFLELDASATMSLSLQAGATGSVTVPREVSLIDDLTTARRDIKPVIRRRGNYIAADLASRNDLAEIEERATTAASTSFGGCFNIGAGLDVNAGANADFFGLFDKSTKVSLFSKKFEIFKKCFGSGGKRSLEELSSRAPHSGSFHRYHIGARQSEVVDLVERAGLLCPAKSIPALQTVTSGTISASSIKQL